MMLLFSDPPHLHLTSNKMPVNIDEGIRPALDTGEEGWEDRRRARDVSATSASSVQPWIDSEVSPKGVVSHPLEICRIGLGAVHLRTSCLIWHGMHEEFLLAASGGGSLILIGYSPFHISQALRNKTNPKKFHCHPMLTSYSIQFSWEE